MKCQDCDETEVEPCTICGKHVCPAHRAGTGRLKDGYQCLQRDCWAVHGHRVFAVLRAKLPKNLEKLPPPRFVYTAPFAMTLARVGLDPGIPVDPPVDLVAGQRVELWWVIAAGEIKYCHEGGRAPAPDDLNPCTICSEPSDPEGLPDLESAVADWCATCGLEVTPHNVQRALTALGYAKRR